MPKNIVCLGCKEERQHYALGLCQKCYRRHRRKLGYKRPIVHCVECGQNREHGALGLCVRCYRRQKCRERGEKLVENRNAKKRGCRVCGVNLALQKNWRISQAERCDYICKTCSNEHSRKYQEYNRDERLAYNRRYHQKNRKAILKRQKQYRMERREELREEARIYREKNPLKVLRSHRGYYRRNRGKCIQASRRWQREHPEEWAANKRRYRARKYGAKVEIYKREALLRRDNSQCLYCGSVEDLTVDHIVPLISGGMDTPDNVAIACRRCNSSKQDKPLEDWLQTQPYSRAWVL